MGKKRIPLTADTDDVDDEPVVTSVDELRADMDKSHMPEEAEQRQQRAGDAVGGQEERPSDRDTARTDIEEEAVQRLVDKLREKGKSERFIEEHMDEIREKARKELQRQERR